MKIAINRCYGGFSLSKEAYEEYLTLKGITFYTIKGKFGTDYSRIPEEEYLALYAECENKPLIENGRFKPVSEVLIREPTSRTDPILIDVIERYGDKASDEYSNIKIVEIPDGVEWKISDYDGMEKVEEIHRSWC